MGMALGDALKAAQEALKASQDAARETSDRIERERQEAAGGSRAAGGVSP
jgi:hypothetical protein